MKLFRSRKNSCCVDVGGSIPVYLNVYDVTPLNGYVYWLGLGVYHSGIQVDGVEYAFGGHEYPSSGIFQGEPKKCQGFTFRKGILIGWTDLGGPEVSKVMEQLGVKYKGNAYNLITRNCNHFCNDAAITLTANPIPAWVNRLATIGLVCNCVIPQSLTTTRIQHHPTKQDNKLGSSASSNTFTTSSSNNPSSANDN